jgi:abnormal spindle-like microcephaly-associated protein
MGFCADMVTAHGDIIRRLRNIGYNLNHKQLHLDEVNYAVKSLNDLRDGTRITRVVEILFKGNPLSQKLRLPAISKLQKIHNVNLAFTRISQHISIEGNISTRDIVNGHREKILSLFWQIIYKYLTPRFNNAATKIQNWWRNSSLKLVILKRIRAKQIAKRHFAATKIQACVRGYLIRNQWPHLEAELIKNREMLHMASNTIKLYLKNKLMLLTDERKRFIILKKTVVNIQRKFRTKMAMVKERKKYLKAKQSVIIIQKVFRGYIIRKNLLQIKKNLSAEKLKRIIAINIIKRALRKNLPLTDDRHKFLKLKQTVLYIENLYIANKLMKLEMEHYTILKNSVVFIQQKFKANIIMKRERRNYLKTKESIILIQKIFRGFMVKKYWSVMQVQLLSKKNKRINAVNVIKRVLRQNLPITTDRLEFLKLKYTVLFVEKLYIANKSMKMQMEHFIALKKMTIFIQQKFRANIAMKKTQNNYLKIKRSTILIQKIFRGYMIRKYWSVMRFNLLCEKKKRTNAINIIIRTLRKNLPKTQIQINFIKLKVAVLFIQRMWRANCLMKIQRKQYTNLRYAVIFIQRKYRAKIKMRTDRHKYLKIQQSLLLIQRVYRGFLVRKNWMNVKTHLIMIKTMRIKSVNIVKHFIRKKLPPTQDELYYNKLKHSTLIIQKRYRANVAMKKQREEFQMLKNSAIILQQRFRAKQAMDTAWKRYTKLKICTIQLQSAIRGYLARKQWPELRNQLQIYRTHLFRCAMIIQKALRKNLPITKERIQFLELKMSVIVIQRRFRANNKSKNQRIEFLRLKSAIIMLQSFARGYLFRHQTWPTFRNSLLETRSRLELCSNIIKRCLRLRLPMTEDRKIFIKLKAATIVIQRRYRANQAMRYQSYKYIKIRMVTIMLQSFARGYLYRKINWPAQKAELVVHRQYLIQCANTIKRMLRKHVVNNDRQQYLELRNAAVIIQRRFRTYLQALKYRKLCAAVLRVQQRFRANVAAKLQWIEYNYTRSMIILLQAYARGYLVRCQWPKTRHALLNHRNQLTTASNTVKRFLRQCLPTTPERSYYLKLRWAAIVVQTRYRAMVLARLVRAKYLQIRQCAIIIQRYYRAHRTIHAAIVLQTHIRGYLARKQWPQLKDRLVTERKFAVETMWVSVPFLFVKFVNTIIIIHH